MSILNPCKYCKTGQNVSTSFVDTVSTTRIVFCTKCGTQSDRMPNLRSAIDNWNLLHPVSKEQVS